MPPDLQSHVRYARDLFTAQSQVFSLYHVQDPTVFYTREDLWNVATQTSGPGQPAEAIRPFYVIMRLPGESSAEFVIILPYTPNGKTNMIGYLAARSDAPHYGELVDFRFPKESLVVGPQQVDANIDQTPSISSQFSLLNQQGSAVVRGNLLVLPIENSILYIEPIYLQASGGTKIPQLKKVIAATGQRVAMNDTLEKALADLLGASPPPTTSQPPPGPSGGTTAADLIRSANQHYQAAQAALKRGDFTTYASEISQVGQILQQLQKLQGSPSPAASAKP
jgi:uncharacterized membrane protein (UPF0182 family)